MNFMVDNKENYKFDLGVKYTNTKFSKLTSQELNGKQ